MPDGAPRDQEVISRRAGRLLARVLLSETSASPNVVHHDRMPDETHSKVVEGKGLFYANLVEAPEGWPGGGGFRWRGPYLDEATGGRSKAALGRTSPHTEYLHDALTENRQRCIAVHSSRSSLLALDAQPEPSCDEEKGASLPPAEADEDVIVGSQSLAQGSPMMLWKTRCSSFKSQYQVRVSRTPSGQ